MLDLSYSLSVAKRNTGNESSLTRSILDALKLRGFFVMRNAQGGRTYRMGLGTGSADIIGVLRGGRIMALEVKTKDGEPSDAQLEWCADVNRLGGYATFVTSIPEALKAAEAAERGETA